MAKLVPLDDVEQDRPKKLVPIDAAPKRLVPLDEQRRLVPLDDVQFASSPGGMARQTTYKFQQPPVIEETQTTPTIDPRQAQVAEQFIQQRVWADPANQTLPLDTKVYLDEQWRKSFGLPSKLESMESLQSEDADTVNVINPITGRDLFKLQGGAGRAVSAFKRGAARMVAGNIQAGAGAAQMLGFTETGDRWSQTAQEVRQREGFADPNASGLHWWLEQGFGLAGEQGTQMLFDVGFALAGAKIPGVKPGVPGLGGPAAFGIVGGVPQGLRSANEAFDDLRAQGISEGAARGGAAVEGVIDGLITYVTNRYLPGEAFFGKLGNNILARSVLADRAKRFGAGFLAEGGQEVLEQIGQETTDIARKWLTGRSDEIPDDIRATLESLPEVFIKGGIVGGVTNVVTGSTQQPTQQQQPAQDIPFAELDEPEVAQPGPAQQPRDLLQPQEPTNVQEEEAATATEAVQQAAPVRPVDGSPEGARGGQRGGEPAVPVGRERGEQEAVAAALAEAEAQKHDFISRKERAELLRKNGLDPAAPGVVDAFKAKWDEMQARKQSQREAEENAALAPFMDEARGVLPRDDFDGTDAEYESQIAEMARDIEQRAERERIEGLSPRERVNEGHGDIRDKALVQADDIEAEAKAAGWDVERHSSASSEAQYLTISKGDKEHTIRVAGHQSGVSAVSTPDFEVRVDKPEWVDESLQKIRQAITPRTEAPQGTEAPARVETQAEAAQPQQRTHSARKEHIKAERQRLGLDELPSPERQTWQSQLDEAKSEGNVAVRSQRLVSDVIANPRALNAKETATVVLRMAELQNELDAINQRIVDMDKGGDTLATRFAIAERNHAEAELDLALAALRRSGTEKGRALAAQRLTINDSYELVPVLARARAAKTKGKTDKGQLTAAERAEFEAMTKKLKETEAELREMREKLQRADAERQVRNWRERKKKTPKQLDEELESLVEKADRLLKAGCDDR